MTIINQTKIYKTHQALIKHENCFSTTSNKTLSQRNLMK